jgi:hypothetical protein
MNADLHSSAITNDTGSMEASAHPLLEAAL